MPGHVIRSATGRAVTVRVSPGVNPVVRRRRRTRERSLFIRTGRLLVFLLTALLLYVLGGELSNDALDYEILWRNLQVMGAREAIATERFEPAFTLLYWSAAQSLSARATFYVVGLSALAVKYYIFTKYLRNPMIAWAIYAAIFLQILDANQIRVAVSACLILYALVTPRSNTSYLVLGAVASLFHYSGLVIGLLYFVRVPIIGLAGVVTLSIVWNAVINSTELLSFARLFLSGTPGGRNLTSTVFIVQLCMAAACALQWKHLTLLQKKGAYLLMLGIVFYISFADNALMAHRMRELSLLGVFPLLFLSQRRLTYPSLVLRLGVGYIGVYTVWFIADELLTIYL